MGIRTKARGSTVDLIIADENPGNSEVPSEVSEGMNSKLCPPFVFPSKNKIPDGAIPADINGGIPCLPTAKMGPHLLFSVMNSLRKRQDVPAEEDPEVHLGQLKRFSLRELQVATDSFSNKNILGRGGFSKVYKGRLADGSLVAVKRLKEKRTQGHKLQFQTEVEMISRAAHRNLLRLRGFCMTRTERLLVYPYMANGSVASCLRDRQASQPPLALHSRKRIALGSARGLSFLHDQCDPKIIHRDIKAANILLDEEFEAVIGDFGLAKLMDCEDTHVTTAVGGTIVHIELAELTDCSDTHLTTAACGTIGHIAPEYLATGKCSEKTDVYAYGIMLLELITGKRAFDLARLANDDDVMLIDWVNDKRLEMLVDPDLQHNYVKAELEQLIQVSLLCTQGCSIQRPKMSEVVRMLEGDGLAERWDMSQKMEAPCRNSDCIVHSSSNSDWIADWSGDSSPNSDWISDSSRYSDCIVHFSSNSDWSGDSSPNYDWSGDSSHNSNCIVHSSSNSYWSVNSSHYYDCIVPSNPNSDWSVDSSH